MKIDSELTEKSAKNTQRWWKLTATIGYRPQTTKNFYDILENVCTQKDRVLDLECFLLGDLNSDFSKTQSPLYQALKHFLYICNWVQVIKEPTRITPTCSSILNVIIVSDEEKISQSGIIPIGISDHFLTYCTRHSPKAKFNKHNTMRSRSMKNYSTEIFNEKLSEINWFKVINCDDVDVAWSNFKICLCLWLIKLHLSKKNG